MDSMTIDGYYLRILFFKRNIGFSCFIMIKCSLQDKAEKDPPFVCPDFIVVDLNATVTMLNYRLFEELDDEKKKGTVLMKSIISPIIAMCCRPNSNFIGICCENGNLYEWNF